MDRLLSNLYYSSDSDGFMSSINSLYRAAKKRNPKVTLRIVTEFLRRQRTYTLMKPTRHKFKRARTTGIALHSHIQMDIADFRKLKYHNSHYSYILCCICVVSKQARCEALKSKSPEHVLPALRKMLDSYENTIYVVTCDSGTEFLASVKTWAETMGIQLGQIKRSSSHASVCERFIRSLKMMIYRYFTFTKQKRWVDDLQKFVQVYNSRYHTAIGRAPNSVTPENEREFIEELYNEKRQPKFRFALKQHVRIKEPKTLFDKGYTQTYTDKIYVVAERVGGRGPGGYRIETLEGQPIRGLWYNQELSEAGVEDGLLRTARLKRARV